MTRSFLFLKDDIMESSFRGRPLKGKETAVKAGCTGEIWYCVHVFAFVHLEIYSLLAFIRN